MSEVSASGVDAVVVGSGPNGLAAAIALAQGGLRVRVYEQGERPGGACSSAGLTLPGFVHDLGSAIHPLGLASPFFGSLPLHAYGLEWVQPDLPLAHPLPEDLGGSALMHRSLEETAAGLGADEGAYLRFMRPLVREYRGLLHDTLRPLLRVPLHPVTLARFGLRALPPASLLARGLFRTPQARALLGGLAAHSGLPLSRPATTAFGLMLGVAGHAVGWPFPRGGAQSLTDALVGLLRHLGGEVVLNTPVESLRQLAGARAVILDTSVPVFLRLAGPQLAPPAAPQLRHFSPGPGTFKVDYALSGPVPWSDPAVGRAGTVHLGGPLEALEASERAPEAGEVAERPFALLAQHTPFDPSRAPAGKHTLWAYIHVPNGLKDPAGLARAQRVLERQIEDAAPGFGGKVLARAVSTPAQLQRWDPNLTGGDVTGGANSLWQVVARPRLSSTPYRTPLQGVYLCSASTPPGGGVHGMGGYGAARAALKDLGAAR